MWRAVYAACVRSSSAMKPQPTTYATRLVHLPWSARLTQLFAKQRQNLSPRQAPKSLFRPVKPIGPRVQTLTTRGVATTTCRWASILAHGLRLCACKVCGERARDAHSRQGATNNASTHRQAGCGSTCLVLWFGNRDGAA